MSTITSTLDDTSVATMTAAPAPKEPDVYKRLSDIFWINSVAISNNGNRVVAATFLHDYRQRTGKGLPNVQGRFGTYCFDADGPKDPADPKALKDPLWVDEFDGSDGVFAVAISGDGAVVASGGWLEKNGNAVCGLLRAYDAATGKALLDCSSINQRVSWVALSENGSVLAAVADDVYVFFRDGKAFNPIPVRLGIGGNANRYVTNVAIHPDGTWLAACDKIGHVYMATIGNGSIASQFRWTASDSRAIPFLSVAIARKKQTFVVGGGNSVFLFDAVAIRSLGDAAVPPEMALEYNTTAGADPVTVPTNINDPARIQENVRWVAVSADGQLLTAVANRNAASKPTGAGVLVALTPESNQLRRLWEVALDNNPNSTSIDAAGSYVAASDGNPTGTPAKFYLFDARGNPRWFWPTCNMNWPIVISRDADAIAAGGDDGWLYYFKP